MIENVLSYSWVDLFLLYILMWFITEKRRMQKIESADGECLEIEKKHINI